MKKNTFTEKEYLALYLTDDGLGETGLIASHLKISDNEVNRIIEKLVKMQLITKEKGHPSLKNDLNWYEITNSGKDFLWKPEFKNYSLDLIL